MYWGLGISGSGPGRMQNSMCTGQPHSREMVSSAVNSVRLQVPPPGYNAFLLKGLELRRGKLSLGLEEGSGLVSQTPPSVETVQKREFR